MKYIVANWKANKNLNEAYEWLEIFLKQLAPKPNISVVICPPLPLLIPLKEKLVGRNNIFLGAQNISNFEEGQYTGETTVKTLKGLVSYAIVGHSERRRYFLEEDDILSQKVQLASKYAITPIYCIRGINDKIPPGVSMIAYEPVDAIGTGQNESPVNVITLKKQLGVREDSIFLYGGSVDPKNSQTYLELPEIAGLLVGTTSLDPVNFAAIVNQA